MSFAIKGTLKLSGRHLGGAGPIKVKDILVCGKMILPPHGKEFFHSTVSSFLHPAVSTFLHVR